MFIEDEATYYSFANGGARGVAIGWLGATAPRTGSVPPTFLDVLAHLLERHSTSDNTCGAHACELCNGHISHGELWLKIDGVRYVMPPMIQHYIEAHGYSPPNEFVRTVLEFWKSDAADACKRGACEPLPKGAGKGYHARLQRDQSD
jgi:hypothetical protein